MDLLGVAGPNCCITCNLQPALKGRSGEGAPAGSSMPKLDSFLFERKEFNCRWRYDCIPFCGRWVGIYKEKLWLLSLLDSDTVSLPLGEEFPFSYHGPTVKG